MDFFEFFFSGPNWGWKVFGLILLIASIGNAISTVVGTWMSYKVAAKVLNESSEEGGVTADDVRS